MVALIDVDLTGAAGAIAPRRRRARSIAAKLGGGLAVLIPVVVLSSFITYCLGALSNSNPAATILGQDAATPAAVAKLTTTLPAVGTPVDGLIDVTAGAAGTPCVTHALQ